MAYATTTYMIIAAIAAAAAAGTTMYSTDTAAKQQEANLKFQADQAEADAQAAAGAAQIEAERIRKQGKAQRAQAVAAAAASGIDVNSPTALKIESNITRNAEEDAVLTIANARDTGARMGQQAQAYRFEGRSVRAAGRTDNAATLLSAVSSAASASGGWKKAPTNGGYVGGRSLGTGGP